MGELVVDSLDGFTPEWITAALQSAGHDLHVVAVDGEAIGTGQMGASFRLGLTYDGAAGPATVVGKIGAGDPMLRDLIKTGYAAEIGFYRHLVADLDVRAPRCWYVGSTSDCAEFTLLLEDAAPAVPGVQADGCSLPQARAAVANLVGLHGPRWGDPTLRDCDFLLQADADAAQMMGDATVGAAAEFVSRYDEQLDAADKRTLQAAAEVITTWQTTETEPATLLHGDYRLDNLLFGPADDDVFAIDWQTATTGPGPRDVAYFLGTSLHTDVRRQHEESIVADYHAALLAAGVSDYDADRCWTDYRRGQLQAPMITMLGCIYASGERTEKSDGMFLAMATRSSAAIRDHDSLSLV